MSLCCRLFAIVFLAGVIAGCGNNQTVKKGTPPEGLSSKGTAGTTNSDSADNSNADSAAGSNATNTNAAPTRQMTPAERRRSRRNMPMANVGGGSGGGIAATPPPQNNNVASNSTNTTNTSTVLSGDTLPNGLFPQMGSSFSSDGYGGGLFPQGSTVSTSASGNSVSSNSGGSLGGGNSGGRNLPGASLGGGGQSSNAGRPGAPGSTAGGTQSTTAATADAGPQSYLEHAEAAFSQGAEADAFKYLYAHVLSDDNAFQKYPMGWFSGLSEPRLAIRWGVGVTFNAPRDFDSRPPVVGAPADSSSGGGASGGGGNGLSGLSDGGAPPPTRGGTDSQQYANVDTSKPEGFLLYYTGDYGNVFLDRIESRRKHNDAFYGAIMKDVEIKYETTGTSSTASSAAPPLTPTQRSRRRRSGLPSGGVDGAGGAQSPADNNATGSIGGTGTASGSSAATRQTRAQRVSGSGASVKPDGQVLGTLTPGVMLVGEASKAELLERAREMKLDVIAIFSVRISSGRKADCTTNLKIINVRTGEEIAKGRNLKTADVDKARERSRDKRLDPVELALDSAFKNGDADVQLKSAPLPAALKPEHVKNRLSDVMSRDDMDKLAVAVEVISFNRKGLLDDDSARTAIDTLLGEGIGQKLLTGTEQQRKTALAALLPGGSGGGSSDGASSDPFR